MAATILAWSSGPVPAASNNGKKPILTKSGQKAALKAATEALIGNPMPAPAAGPPVEIPGVPHYFGPWPNWANSPYTVPDVKVMIESPVSGTMATATATTDSNDGSVLPGFTVTDPGTIFSFSPAV